MPSQATRVGIAVVEQQGRYLVGIRDAAGPLPGLAEFPGGKCLPGESPKECARRECLEETGLEVTPLKLLLARTFQYLHDDVDLNFWLCRPARREASPRLAGCFCWVEQADLGSLRFPEANQPVLDLLANRTGPS